MNSFVILTTAISGFGVAFLHALIPVHWLPFVLAGRVQGWSLARTLLVAMAAGAAHVVATAVIGAAAAVLGLTLEHLVEGVLPRVVAAVLVVFALYAFWRQRTPRHAHTTPAATVRRDGAVVAGLVLMLLVSPCEAFVPMYVAGVPFGWPGFVLLTVVFAVATLAAMTLFVTLAWRGLATPRLALIEHYEPALFGVVLLMLAALILLVP